MIKTLLILMLFLLFSCNAKDTQEREYEIIGTNTVGAGESSELNTEDIAAPNESSTSVSQGDAPSLFE